MNSGHQLREPTKECPAAGMLFHFCIGGLSFRLTSDQLSFLQNATGLSATPGLVQARSPSISVPHIELHVSCQRPLNTYRVCA